MNATAITDLIEKTKTDVDFAEQLSNTIVAEQTSELDAIMRGIQTDVVHRDNPDDYTIQTHLLELTNALYFINARCEYFGFYEDITKANARLKYNEMYAQFQLNSANAGKKPTQADCQREAELNSIDENMLNIIYNRSVRVIKGKLDAANEMVRTLSKLLSVHMNNAGATATSRRLYE